jgi:hypothetical protein
MPAGSRRKESGRIPFFLTERRLIKSTYLMASTTDAYAQGQTVWTASISVWPILIIEMGKWGQQ